MEVIICRSTTLRFEFFILFLFCFCLRFSMATDAITQNQPIKDPGSIISIKKTFELGFFSPANTTIRYVGIWFGNISVRTVVWVANRDRPLNDSTGTFTISDDGNLVLLNGELEIIWSSYVSNPVPNSTAQLLDSGNFVLFGTPNGSRIWESFEFPSDSLLTNMKLTSDANTNEKTPIKSWKSPSDPSIGNFSLGINPLTIPDLFIWNGDRPYWRSGPWDSQTFIGIPEMNSFYLDGFTLVDDKQGNVYLTFTYARENVLTYYVLTHNGSLLEKIWNRETKEWMITFSIPDNECDIYGKCGPFGSCNSKEVPICSCLRGYKPKSVEEWDSRNFTSGCVRWEPLQCERNNSSSEENKNDGFFKMTTMKLPVFPERSNVNEDECGNQCLQNCSCIAYAYNERIGCMGWNGSLVDIQKFSTDGADLYIRVASSELDKKKNTSVIIAVSVILGTLILAVCVYFSWMCMVKQRGMKNRKGMRLLKKFPSSPESSTEIKLERNLNRVKLEEVPLFNLEKLAIATDNFDSSNKLGQGGFGSVYKGKLKDGKEIAVKRLSRSSDQGVEEFMNEVVVISKLQHRNLVRLLGCCIEGEEKMLIYEYMPNKSLDAFLFDPRQQKLLDWSKRLSIIEGIGRGLIYLHRDSRLKIIHRDLKASNILLDKELNPKISDFGMARIFAGSEDQAKTRKVVGTYGYMSPEYAMQGKFSEKSDVFSFGVLLLEIVSGRRNTSFYHDEEHLSLLGYAWKMWNEDNISSIIDSRIACEEFRTEIAKCIHVGILCVQEFAVDRPTISTVVSMLCSEIPLLANPKPPAFTQRSASLHRQPSQRSQIRCSMNDYIITTVEGR